MAPKVQYDCLFCDASYSIKGSFTNHVNKKHKKEQVLRTEEARNQAKMLKPWNVSNYSTSVSKVL